MGDARTDGSGRAGARAFLRRSWRPLVLLLVLAEVVVLSLNTMPSSPRRGPQPQASGSTAGVDWAAMRPRWHRRLETLLEAGNLPILDIESSFHDLGFFTPEFRDAMDELAVGIIVFSPNKSTRWREVVAELLERADGRVIPASPVGHRSMSRGQGAIDYLDRTFKTVVHDHYPMLGEYFVRHYPPNRRQTDDLWDRADVNLAIDGPEMQHIFRFSQDHGIPFEIHLEVEDPFLPPLEKMLAAYPRATVVWCHFGRVRYPDRGRRYTAAYVRHLLETYPNLFFDVSCSDAESLWPRTHGTRVSRMWDPAGRHLLPEWRQLFLDHPDRFLAALDLGLSTEIGALRLYTAKLRRLLDELPPDVRSAVAYRNGWRMLFHEEF